MGDLFMTMYEKYTPSFARFARRIARGDRDLADDLVQEGWVAFLVLPEERWDEETYVHTVVCRAMRRTRNRELRRCIVQGEPRHASQKGRERQVEVIHLFLEGGEPQVNVGQLPRKDAA